MTENEQRLQAVSEWFLRLDSKERTVAIFYLIHWQSQLEDVSQGEIILRLQELLAEAAEYDQQQSLAN